MISDDGMFLESEKLLQARLSPIHLFKLMGIVNSIPNEWKLIIKQSQQHIFTLFRLPSHTTHKTREFQYKLLNNVIFTSEKLFR